MKLQISVQILKLQFLRIPIRDWNISIGLKIFSRLKLQFLRIPIRDWNDYALYVENRDPYIRLQFLRIPIRDWNKKLARVTLEQSNKLQFLRIPIRDWNRVYLYPTCGVPSLQFLRIPIRDWNPRWNRQRNQWHSYNFYESLLGIETILPSPKAAT